MDLRAKKTLKSINNAFLELRSKKALSAITVKELCQKAEISKPTFYLHYRDIYDLSEHLEDEVIDNILCGFSLDKEELLSPDFVWLNHLFDNFIAQGQLLNLLFSQDRKNVFMPKLSLKIKERIYDIFPEAKDNLKINLYLDFTIHGTFMAYTNNKGENLPEVRSLLTQYTSRFFNSIYDLFS